MKSVTTAKSNLGYDWGMPRTTSENQNCADSWTNATNTNLSSLQSKKIYVDGLNWISNNVAITKIILIFVIKLCEINFGNFLNVIKNVLFLVDIL